MPLDQAAFCNNTRHMRRAIGCPDGEQKRHFYIKTTHGGESTARGFEPLRAEPNGFLVHHLSHSVTLSLRAELATHAHAASPPLAT